MPPDGWGPPGLVFLGLKGILRKSEQRAGWHYEPISAGALTPPNLHLAQLERRTAASRMNSVRERPRKLAARSIIAISASGSRIESG